MATNNAYYESPISRAFNDDSANRLAMAQRQFMDAEAQQRAVALLNLRESGDDRRLQTSIGAQREIEGMRIKASDSRNEADNRAAMDRTKEQIRGYMDRLTEADNLKLARSLYPLVPREKDETVEAYIERASAIAPQVVSDTILKFHDEQLDGIKKQADSLAEEESKRVKTAAEAFTASKVPLDNTTITNKQALAAVQAARAAGRPVEEAIQAALIKVGSDAKAATELNSLLENFRTTRAAVTEELSRTPSKEYLSGMTFLRPQMERAMADRDRVYNSDLGRQGLLYRAKAAPKSPDGASIVMPPPDGAVMRSLPPTQNPFALPAPSVAPPPAESLGALPVPLLPSNTSVNSMVLPPPPPQPAAPLPWSRNVSVPAPWQTNALPAQVNAPGNEQPGLLRGLALALTQSMRDAGPSPGYWKGPVSPLPPTTPNQFQLPAQALPPYTTNTFDPAALALPPSLRAY